VKIWWIHFVFMYENISIKFVEFLRSGKGEWGIIVEGINLIKIYGKHICKCHNVSPCTTIIC
jgi:hypothetical protein